MIIVTSRQVRIRLTADTAPVVGLFDPDPVTRAHVESIKTEAIRNVYGDLAVEYIDFARSLGAGDYLEVVRATSTFTSDTDTISDAAYRLLDTAEEENSEGSAAYIATVRGGVSEFADSLREARIAVPGIVPDALSESGSSFQFHRFHLLNPEGVL